MRNLIIVAAPILLFACMPPKPDKASCENAAKHVANIGFTEELEKALTDLPEDQRAAQKEAATKAWDEEKAGDHFIEGLDDFVGECIADMTKTQVDCALKAKTMEEIDKCDGGTAKKKKKKTVTRTKTTTKTTKTKSKKK